MEQDNLEEKLKIETEMTSLRKELKNLSAQVVGAKNEYNGIVTLTETNKKSLEENKEYLQVVLNDIAAAKVAWLQEKNTEILALEEKESAAQNILNRKAELNTQEESIRQETTKNTQTLADTRALEFKLEQDKTAIEVKENALKEKEKEVEEKNKKNESTRQLFKESVLKLLESAQNF